MRVRTSTNELGGGLTRAASLCAAFAACAALPAFAGEPPASEPVQASAEAEVAPNVGMRIAIDAATGMPRPLTAKEAAELDALAAKSRAVARAPAVRVFTARGGAVGAELDSSYMVYSVATVGADGKPRMECVTGEDHADAAVHDHAHADGNEHQETGYETR
jgi:hypothetical protein